MPQLLHDPVAHWLIVATAVAVSTGEIVATYLGRAREESVKSSAAWRTHRCCTRTAAVRYARTTESGVIVALALYLAIAAALCRREVHVSGLTPTAGGLSAWGSP